MVYASKAEARYAKHLDLLKKNGEIWNWDGQVRVPLIVNGVKVTTMVPDFLVFFEDGRTEYREVKGFETAVWKLKRKLFEALHPDVPYIVITAREVP